MRKRVRRHVQLLKMGCAVDRILGQADEGRGRLPAALHRARCRPRGAQGRRPSPGWGTAAAAPEPAAGPRPTRRRPSAASPRRLPPTRLRPPELAATGHSTPPSARSPPDYSSRYRVSTACITGDVFYLEAPHEEGREVAKTVDSNDWAIAMTGSQLSSYSARGKGSSWIRNGLRHL
jgi:hypothetical protein